MTLTSRPGWAAAMPRSMAACVTSTSFFACSEPAPAMKLPQLSPWTPCLYAVMSTLTMSPSSMTVESGMPWQMTSLIEVHSDLGNGGRPAAPG